jgi:hypothetical protein
MQPERDSNLHELSAHKALNLIPPVYMLPAASRSSKSCGFPEALEASDGMDVVKLLSRLARQAGRGRSQVQIPSPR